MDSFGEQEIILLTALGVTIMTAFGLSVVLFYHQTRRKLMQQTLRNQQLLLEKTILTQEKERKRIAKDLHDEVGGKLNIAHLYIQQLRQKSPDSPEVQSTSEGVSEMINSAITATRRISHDLLPPILEEFGLERALYDLAKNYSKSDSLMVQVEVDVDHFPIASQMVELNLFRIIQELISNSIKHGQAKQLSIQLSGSQKTILLQYRDDGKGFTIKDKQKSQGLGMKNIESRLQIINGSWNFEASSGMGFQAFIKINLT
jgi:two-component system NarL family sensor kinase